MLTVGDDPGSEQFPSRIVHVHIPKTAGSALSEAFQRAYGGWLRVYPERFEPRYKNGSYSDYNFFTGHIGFKVASEIGGDLITVLRDPVDRFLSTYFYWKQLYNSGAELSYKTSLAVRFDLDQFVQISDEPVIQEALLNRMTWQLAYSDRLNRRQDLIDRGVDDNELVRIAIANLANFAIVGLQTDMVALAGAIRRKYNVHLSIGHVNVTGSKVARNDISPGTLHQIDQWVYLDQQLLETWIRLNQQPVGVPASSRLKSPGSTSGKDANRA